MQTLKAKITTYVQETACLRLHTLIHLDLLLTLMSIKWDAERLKFYR